MAVIFMTEKRIQYFDSMNGSGATCLKVLLKYVKKYISAARVAL